MMAELLESLELLLRSMEARDTCELGTSAFSFRMGEINMLSVVIAEIKERMKS